MIFYPNAKINIGLNVVNKRNDGFHDIETIFYPLQLSDVLEMVASKEFEFSQSGIEIEGDTESNLVVKAFRLMQKLYSIGNVKIHLHKIIPFGAGLGGGSSDAAFVIVGLNRIFKLGLLESQMAEIAGVLGSDCPFFVLNRPVFAEGRGELFSDCILSLKGKYLVLVKPNVHVPTATAYSKVKPRISEYDLKELVIQPIVNWNDKVKNDFEESVLPVFSEIENVKSELIKAGAIYSAMSGSGSSVFGLFDKRPNANELQFVDNFVWIEELL